MSAMRFGYFANSNNRNLTKPYQQVLNETIELAQYLDAEDWQSIWFTEHHFGHEGFEVCPNPVMMRAWAAADTSKRRTGRAEHVTAGGHARRSVEQRPPLE